jgi:hypothetical protein
MKKKECDSFSELQKRWYQRLKADGFDDIENENVGGFEFDAEGPVSANSGGRPLKKWSGISNFVLHDGESINVIDKFQTQDPLTSLQSNFPQAIVCSYESLYHSDEFHSICIFVCKHRNRKINVEQVKNIWVLYMQGGSMREIGHELIIHNSTVFRIIQAIKQWL